MEDELLKTKEVAKLLDLKTLGVNRLVRLQKIPFVRISSKIVRFRKSDIMRILAAQTTTTTKE